MPRPILLIKNCAAEPIRSAERYVAKRAHIFNGVQVQSTTPGVKPTPSTRIKVPLSAQRRLDAYFAGYGVSSRTFETWGQLLSAYQRTQLYEVIFSEFLDCREHNPQLLSRKLVRWTAKYPEIRVVLDSMLAASSDTVCAVDFRKARADRHGIRPRANDK